MVLVRAKCNHVLLAKTTQVLSAPSDKGLVCADDCNPTILCAVTMSDSHSHSTEVSARKSLDGKLCYLSHDSRTDLLPPKDNYLLRKGAQAIARMVWSPPITVAFVWCRVAYSI